MASEILFVETFRNQKKIPPLTPYNIIPNVEVLRCISLLRKKYSVGFLDQKITTSFIRKLEKELLGGITKVVFLEVRFHTKKILKEILGLTYKSSRKIEVVIHGHYSIDFRDEVLELFPKTYFLAENLLSSCMEISEGEGFPDISSISNLSYSKEGELVSNQLGQMGMCAEMPYVDLNLLLSKKYYLVYPMKKSAKSGWGFLTLSMGCPHRCTFCSSANRVSVGREYSHFSVNESLKRIKRMVDSGLKTIRFSDDEFLVDKNFIKELCRGIIGKGIIFSWSCQTRVKSIDFETLELMSKAGLELVCIGVESGSDEVLFRNKKGHDAKSIVRCFDICRQVGVNTVAYVIIGNPGEKKRDLLLTFNLIERITPSFLQISYFTPYPGTQYYEDLKVGEKKMDIHHHENIILNLSEVGSRELEKTVRKWYLSFYFTPRVFLINFKYRILNFPFYPIREFKIMLYGLRRFIMKV